MERIPTEVAENTLRSAGRSGLQAVGQFLVINQRAAAGLMSVNGESIRRWMELNQEYLREVTDRPAPQRVLELNANYARKLLSEISSDARKRAAVITRASRECITLFTVGTSDNALSTDPSAGGAGAAVVQMATGSDVSPAELREVAQEAMDDDLQQIDGIGEAMAKTLREGGVTTIAELAVLDVDSLKDENHPLHSVAGRLVADEWIEQARRLCGLPENHTSH